MIELCWLEVNYQREVDLYSGIYCWFWLEVFYMEVIRVIFQCDMVLVKIYLLE